MALGTRMTLHIVLLLQGGSRIEKGAADRSFALAAKNYVTRLFNPPKVSHLAAFTSATAYRGLACEQLQCLRTVADGCGWLRSAKKHSERTRLRPPPPRAAKLNKNSYTHSGKAKTHLQGLRQPSDKVPASKRFQRKTRKSWQIAARHGSRKAPPGGSSRGAWLQQGSRQQNVPYQQDSSKLPGEFSQNFRSGKVPTVFQQGSSMVLEIPQTLLLSKACS